MHVASSVGQAARTLVSCGQGKRTPVAVQQEPLERLFDEDEVEVRQALGNGLMGPDQHISTLSSAQGARGQEEQQPEARAGPTRKAGLNSLMMRRVRSLLDWDHLRSIHVFRRSYPLM